MGLALGHLSNIIVDKPIAVTSARCYLGGVTGSTVLSERSMQTMPYPAKKTDKLVAEVLERLSLGETLKSIARDLQFSTVSWNQWVRSDEALAHAHAEARDAGADAVADDVLEIVDTPPERFEGKIDNGSISWARNRAEYRLRLLGHWRPEKYGTKPPDKTKSDEEDKIDEIDLMLRVTERLLASKRDAE